MSRKRVNRPLDDTPVVREIRAIRRKILDQSDGTVEGYFAKLRQLADKRRREDAARQAASGKTTASKKSRRKAA